MRLTSHKKAEDKWPEDLSRIGGYTLLERLGVGGMAEVFLARAPGPERPGRLVAIKRILPEITRDQEVIGILFEEALKAQRLVHPNICEILELGQIGESHFIAMEHLRGWSLAQLGTRLHRAELEVPVAAALRVAVEICRALDHAHRADLPGEPEPGVVHRGLTPRNVFVDCRGGVKVTDFCIGRAAASLLHGRARVLKRGFGFAAPEQVLGHAVDRRADLFSLGAILYELLTGERAFHGENDLVTLDRIRRGDLVPPSRLRPGLPVEVDRIVARALAGDPGDRYGWARDLERDLRRCLAELGPTDVARWLAEVLEEEIAAEQARLESFGTPAEERPSSPALEL
jgi:serine/threonine protein kinase